MRKSLVTSYTLLRLKNLKDKAPGCAQKNTRKQYKETQVVWKQFVLSKEIFFKLFTWIHSFCLYTITILLFFCLCYERDECF